MIFLRHFDVSLVSAGNDTLLLFKIYLFILYFHHHCFRFTLYLHRCALLGKSEATIRHACNKWTECMSSHKVEEQEEKRMHPWNWPIAHRMFQKCWPLTNRSRVIWLINVSNSSELQCEISDSIAIWLIFSHRDFQFQVEVEVFGRRDYKSHSHWLTIRQEKWYNTQSKLMQKLFDDTSLTTSPSSLSFSSICAFCLSSALGANAWPISIIFAFE